MRPDYRRTHLVIDRLQPADIPAALRLSTQAGWNQLDADWRRLIDLWPDGCFAGRVDGELVATATLATYGQVAWVGMVLVDEAQRGRGFGGAIMDHVIADADRRGIRSLGLDASDMGRPVYLKRGFADACPIERRVLAVAGLVPRDAHLVREADWPGVLALDRRATGWDRSRLLTALRHQPGAVCYVARGAAGVTAFGFRRPGRVSDHVGPLVGDREDAYGVISRLAVGAERPVIMDSFVTVPQLLEADEYEVSRRLTRMYRGAAQQVGDQVAAASGFELG